MLSTLNRKKRSASVEPVTSKLHRQFPKSSAERAARLIIAARAKLAPLTNEKLTYMQANKMYGQLGDLDGVGLLLKLASFEIFSARAY